LFFEDANARIIKSLFREKEAFIASTVKEVEEQKANGKHYF